MFFGKRKFASFFVLRWRDIVSTAGGVCLWKRQECSWSEEDWKLSVCDIFEILYWNQGRIYREANKVLASEPLFCTGQFKPLRGTLKIFTFVPNFVFFFFKRPQYLYKLQAPQNLHPPLTGIHLGSPKKTKKMSEYPMSLSRFQPVTTWMGKRIFFSFDLSLMDCGSGWTWSLV